MMRHTEFLELLKAKRILVIDGGLATELESRGHDLAHPLWSGKILIGEHDAMTSIHYDFYKAGADIAVTASYQTSVDGLVKYLDVSPDDARDLISQSVQHAKAARDQIRAGDDREQATTPLLIAGSVGPYGAYLCDGSEYRGDYELSKEALKDFHRGRLQALVEAGVDLLALETMPNITEIEALLELLIDEFPGAIAWLSCTLRDSEHISDGTDVRQVIAAIERAGSQIVAFGINCVPPKLVEEFLVYASGMTLLPLLCYPNSGEVYDAQTKAWVETSEAMDKMFPCAKLWASQGAKLIGGCCRVSVEDIRSLVQSVDNT